MRKMTRKERIQWITNLHLIWTWKKKMLAEERSLSLSCSPAAGHILRQECRKALASNGADERGASGAGSATISGNNNMEETV